MVDCQAKMSDLDQKKLEQESQKSRLIGTIDEIRQELAAQKVWSVSNDAAVYNLPHLILVIVAQTFHCLIFHMPTTAFGY